MTARPSPEREELKITPQLVTAADLPVLEQMKGNDEG